MSDDSFRDHLDQLVGHQVCAYTGREKGHPGRLEEVTDDYLMIVATTEISADRPWRPGEDEPLVTLIPMGQLMAIEKRCCSQTRGGPLCPELKSSL